MDQRFFNCDLRYTIYDLRSMNDDISSAERSQHYVINNIMPISATAGVAFKFAQLIVLGLANIATCDFNLPEAKAAAAALASFSSSSYGHNVVVGDVSHVEESHYFHIYYGQTFKVIKNGIDGKSYLLMQNKSRMATTTKYCTARIKSFVIPLSNYSVDTRDFPVSFFELLGMLESMKGITSDEVASQCTLNYLSNGDITMVNASSDTKELQMFEAHFVSSPDNDNQCNYVVFAPMEEITPLKRAEWIKYLGAFVNAEARANYVFEAVRSNYICLRNFAANQTSEFKPLVAWIEFDQGIWRFAKEEYKKQYVLDAGGENIDNSIAGSSYNISIEEDMEGFHSILCIVDVVIDETPVMNPVEYTMSTFLDNIRGQDRDEPCYEFITNKSIWRYDKLVANNTKVLDWNDGGISQPQIVLGDLIQAFFPTGNYTPIYFRNIALEEPVIVRNTNETGCSRSYAEPLQPTIVPCNYM